MSKLDSVIALELGIPPDPYSKDWHYCGTLIDALIKLNYVVSFEVNEGLVFVVISDFDTLDDELEPHREVCSAPTKEKALCLAARRMLRRKK